MRVHSREFRLQAVRRILAGEKVATVSEDLGIHRKLLYEWLHRVIEGGEANLRERGRPSKQLDAASQSGLEPIVGVVPRQVTELERTVAYQQQVIDFFRPALPLAGS